MEKLDLVIRGGVIITASDRMQADVGIRDGKIVAVGLDLPAGVEEIDATGLMVMPGGIDSHVHISQPSGEAPVPSKKWAGSVENQASTPPSATAALMRVLTASACSGRIPNVQSRPGLAVTPVLTVCTAALTSSTWHSNHSVR